MHHFVSIDLLTRLVKEHLLLAQLFHQLFLCDSELLQLCVQQKAVFLVDLSLAAVFPLPQRLHLIERGVGLAGLFERL